MWLLHIAGFWTLRYVPPKLLVRAMEEGGLFPTLQVASAAETISLFIISYFSSLSLMCTIILQYSSLFKPPGQLFVWDVINLDTPLVTTL